MTKITITKQKKVYDKKINVILQFAFPNAHPVDFL